MVYFFLGVHLDFSELSVPVSVLDEKSDVIEKNGLFSRWRIDVSPVCLNT